MAQVKSGKVKKPILLTDEVLGWLDKRADYHGSTPSAEINIAIREKMEAEAAKERQLASAGT
jgi:hypothetical protein